MIEERIYPELIFDNPQSLIAICLAYPSQIHQKLPREVGKKRGRFARASWGIDYHMILQEKLNQLIHYMEEEVPDAQFKSMVDTGELSDVMVAHRAGLGFIGRNGLLITEEFGSWVYLGEILCDIPFEPDKIVPFGCGDCYRCVKTCPTGALIGDGTMNGRICLSYQTQTKGYMPEEYRRKMANVIYGCDICQLCCPYNQGKDVHHHPEMEPDPELVQPLLQPMLTLSNKEFKTKFGPMAGSWRGKKPLQRNAIIALANSRDQTALPVLLELLEKDPRPMIRGTSAWAISKIQRYRNPLITECVANQLARETEDETIAEMTKALRTLEEKKLPKDEKKTSV